MTSLRKRTLAWLLVLTALAATSVGGSFIYLSGEIPTGPAFIEANLSEITDSLGVNLVAARKAGYTDQQIAAGLAKKNQAEFDHRWYRILAIVGLLYFVSVLGVLAVMLLREAKS